MANNPAYVQAAVTGALADFDRDAGPGNINDPLFILACRLMTLTHAAPDVYSETDAERDATDRALALGHARQSIRDTWKSAQRRTAGQAAVIPALTHTNGNGHMPQGYADLAAYAQAHGVDVSVFVAAGWSDDVLYEYLGKDGEPKLINTKPYAVTRTRRAVRFETDAGPRWRLLDSERGSKYWHCHATHQGESRRWYRLTDALVLAATGGPLVLCNGEASTVTAQHYGIVSKSIALYDATFRFDRAILPGDTTSPLSHGRSIWDYVSRSCR